MAIHEPRLSLPPLCLCVSACWCVCVRIDLSHCLPLSQGNLFGLIFNISMYLSISLDCFPFFLFMLFNYRLEQLQLGQVEKRKAPENPPQA